MAENLIDLRRRIKTVKSTQKTFRAMKTVSAVKLRRSVSELNKNKPVINKITSLLKQVSPAVDTGNQPFLKPRESGRIIIVIISGDKGLCGAFNSRLIAAAEEHYLERVHQAGHHNHEDHQVGLVIAGNKAINYFSKKGYPIEKTYKSMMSRLKSQHGTELSAYLQEIYLHPQKNIKQIEFIFTEFLSASKSAPGIKQLFPLGTEWQQVGENTGDEDIEYIFEPGEKEIFEYLLPKYIDAHIQQILLQSAASEHKARMIAMEQASQNAEEIIRTLTLTMNKLRQASITGELLEIITATEALKK
ncbi:MAG: ATP synthase F1 subunit gamma [Acidobacteria bacterium]|jgi:F-type H+-transporting ATPase subunit gamma|nr:ATP synthase F1 subunit gamma [Acidobacteriota bacterium]